MPSLNTLLTTTDPYLIIAAYCFAVLILLITLGTLEHFQHYYYLGQDLKHQQYQDCWRKYFEDSD